jgi:hypothetical protein
MIFTILIFENDLDESIVSFMLRFLLPNDSSTIFGERLYIFCISLKVYIVLVYYKL